MGLYRRRWVLGSLLGAVGIGAALLSYYVNAIVNMPGRSWSGALPALSAEEAAVRERFREHIHQLVGVIGERNFRRPQALQRAADYLSSTLRRQGYTPSLQSLTINGVTQANIEAELRGASRPGEILIIGAHYDTVRGSPGADDNGSGSAALLEIARLCADQSFARTLRFVFFFNEEEHSPGPTGGALYARRCRERRENVMGMMSLEMLGCFTNAPHSQHYPKPFSLFYPSTGNFIGFVGNFASRAFVHQAVGAFRKATRFPSMGVAAPAAILRDAARSDHVAFWRMGYPGLMVTDTANFRYPYYHRPQDTPEKLNYDGAARVTVGLARAVGELAGGAGK